jgi:CHAD domain-containing protein
MTELHTLTPPDADAPSPSASNRRQTDPYAPHEPLIVAAYSILRREFDALVALQPASDTPPTPEQIHQLRVTSRRLRVGLRLFRRMLPSREAVRWRDDLRWFARALGEVRDLDVYAENFRAYAQRVPLDQHAGLGAYELYLRRARLEARTKLATIFETPRCSRLFADAATALAQGPPAGALRRWRSLEVREGVRAAIKRSLRRVRRLGRTLTSRSRPAEFHELRIRAKRLRYELEFFSAIYPALKSAAKATKALQDVLGEHQDAYAASARLRRYAATLRSDPTARAALPPALDELRKGQLRHAREIRQSFDEHWRLFLPLVTEALRVTE